MWGHRPLPPPPPDLLTYLLLRYQPIKASLPTLSPTFDKKVLGICRRFLSSKTDSDKTFIHPFESNSYLSRCGLYVQYADTHNFLPASITNVIGISTNYAKTSAILREDVISDVYQPVSKN